MATTEVEICNSALIKVGAERIISLDDTSKTARLCKEQYSKLRDEVLYSHPWNFAIARKELAKTVNTPEFEFDAEFILPSDCLRVISIDGNTPQGLEEVHWSIETRPDSSVRVLLTNADVIKIKYIRKITTVALFTPAFVEVLASRIAADLAYSLVQSVSLQAQLEQRYLTLLSQARSFDAQEGSLKVIEAYDWIQARN